MSSPARKNRNKRNAKKNTAKPHANNPHRNEHGAPRTEPVAGDVNVVAMGVGSRHPAWRPGQPEGAHYNFDVNGHHVLYMMAKPDSEEIRAFQTGPCQFGLIEEPDAVVLLLDWEGGCADAPYCWHHVPIAERAIPEPLMPGTAPGLFMTLIDSNTGLIRAMRVIAPSFEFGAALEKAIAKQATRPISQAAHSSAVTRMYDLFPNPRAMFAAATATWRTPGRQGLSSLKPAVPFYRVSCLNMAGKPLQHQDVETVAQAVTLVALHAKLGRAPGVSVMSAGRADEDRLLYELTMALCKAGLIDVPEGYSLGSHDVLIVSSKV